VKTSIRESAKLQTQLLTVPTVGGGEEGGGARRVEVGTGDVGKGATVVCAYTW
jgi:hypothetical protein